MRDWNRCSVKACEHKAEAEFEADQRKWLLCNSHFERAARALNEVMTHLLETGQTYLPGTAETVLVEYSIEPDEASVAAFKDWRGHLSPDDTPGFIGENLYRVRFDGEDDGKAHFVNVGHWRARDDFETKFPTARPDALPGREHWEAGQRRRGWLSRD